MRFLKLLIPILIIGCSGTTPVNSRDNFTFSKALVELSYISNETSELQQLLTIVESNASPSKKFTGWDTKFEDSVKIEVIKKYIKEGHKGL
jgi:hypothetical protein